MAHGALGLRNTSKFSTFFSTVFARQSDPVLFAGSYTLGFNLGYRLHPSESEPRMLVSARRLERGDLLAQVGVRS